VVILALGYGFVFGAAFVFIVQAVRKRRGLA
jgi:hypothetical protein